MTSVINKSLLLIITFMIGSDWVSAQSTALNELKSKFDDDQIMIAQFRHSFTDSYTGEVLNSEGEIVISSNGYKLTGEDQILVVDGEVSTVYDALKNRVIISFYDPEEDDFAPSRTLNGVDSTYTVSEEKDKGDIKRIVMKTDDDFAVFPVIEIFADRNNTPLQILAVDAADNQILTLFENARFIPKAQVDFTINYPEDAEIIDMRIE